MDSIALRNDQMRFLWKWWSFILSIRATTKLSSNSFELWSLWKNQVLINQQRYSSCVPFIEIKLRTSTVAFVEYVSYEQKWKKKIQLQQMTSSQWWTMWVPICEVYIISPVIFEGHHLVRVY